MSSTINFNLIVKNFISFHFFGRNLNYLLKKVELLNNYLDSGLNLK